MVKPNPNLNQSQEIKVNMKEEEYYFTQEGGMVIIYKIEPENELESFYIASFDDMSSDTPWGIGFTPESALKDAVRRWDEESDDENEKKNNPFREVLESLGE